MLVRLYSSKCDYLVRNYDIQPNGMIKLRIPNVVAARFYYFIIIIASNNCTQRRPVLRFVILRYIMPLGIYISQKICIKKIFRLF